MSGPTYLPDQPHPLHVEDVLGALRKQHEATRTSLAELDREFGTSRRTSLHALKCQLACHETAEQRIVHPVAAALGADPAARDRIEEEGRAGELFGRLEKLDVDSEEFDALFGELADDIRAHAAAEEQDEWPALEQVRDETVLGQMFTVVEAVPQMARRIDVPALSTAYEELLEWAQERIDEQLPDGMALDRLREADAQPGQPGERSQDAGPPGDGRHRLKRAAGVAGLAVGAYLVGRRRGGRSEKQAGTSKPGRPGGQKR